MVADALHKDVRALLVNDLQALRGLPLAVFALGPIKAADGLDASREEPLTAFAKVSARCQMSPTSGGQSARSPCYRVVSRRSADDEDVASRWTNVKLFIYIPDCLDMSG